MLEQFNILEQLNIYFIEECNSIDISNELKYKGYIDLSGLNNDELWIHANEYGYKEQRQIFYDCCYNKMFYDYYLSTLRNIVFYYNNYFDWQSYVKSCNVEINSEYYALNKYISKNDLSNSPIELLDISYTNTHYSIISECANYDYKKFPFAYGAGQWSSSSFGVIIPCKSKIKRAYFMYLYDSYENYSTYSNLDEYNFNNDKTKIRLDLYINGSISDYYIEETLDPSINMLGVLFKKNNVNNKSIIVDYNEIVLEENSVISWFCSDLLSKTLDEQYTNYPYNPYRNRLIIILEPYNSITNVIKQNIIITNDISANKVIVGNTTPILGNELTSKSYVDGQVTGVQSNITLLSNEFNTLSGDVYTISGDITVIQSELATKQNIITETTDISVNNLTATTINRANSIIMFYRFGNETFGNYTEYKVPIARVNGSINTLLINHVYNLDGSTSNFTEWIVYKSGAYKLSINVLIDHGTYTDRINWRLRLFVNDSNSSVQGSSYVYTCHTNYVDYGSIQHITLQNFTSGDTFYYLLDCNRAQENGFISTLSESQILNGTSLVIEYFGT